MILGNKMKERLRVRRFVKRLIGSLFTISIFSFPNSFHTVQANEDVKEGILLEQATKYQEFLSNTEFTPYTSEPVRIDLEASLSITDRIVERGETLSFEITAPEKALYAIDIEYLIENDNILPTQAAILINGEQPYFELNNILFESLWQMNTEIPRDRYDNEIPPPVIKVKEFQTKALKDGSYRTTDDLLIPLEKGQNTLQITVSESQVQLRSITLRGTNEIKPDQNVPIIGEELITIEAENVSSQNDSSIRAGSSFDNVLTPYDTSKKVLNFLDRASYKNPGQKISYQFDAAEAGGYHLTWHYLQGDKVDFPIFVNVYLNGELISESFKNYPISYTNKFKLSSFVHSETGEPLALELSSGQNEITFELTIDPIRNIIEETENIMLEIQSLSLVINNIIGNNPDRNRDIDLDEYVPGIEQQLFDWADQLQSLYQQAQEIAGTDSEVGAFTSLTIAEKQLRDMAENPREIASRVNELSSGSNSISSYLGNLLQEANRNGLSIDKIMLHQSEAALPKVGGFFSKIASSVMRFFNSFGEQSYETSSTNTENLQVWVNRPRQYIEIIQQMIDEEFTPATGIQVDLSIMPDQNKLILANSSGDAPDVATGINYALPFDLAIRNALVDLSQFEDYEEVAERFPANLIVPGTIEEQVYALPETMNFYVLFYRKDILDSIGLEVPDTMNDVIQMLPALQQNGMNFFYPTAGMAGMKIFAGTMPIVYQNGGQFYDQYLGNTLLNEEKAIEGMRKLTDLFTIYNMPYDVPSFYQSFRDGSLPIGISDYGAYNLILNAAPEIQNLWEISLMPGTENEQGEITRWSSGGAESDVIFADSEMKDESWEYLKWWLSDEVQADFGERLQVTYGEEYVWNTANLNAFEQLPWATSDKETILAQAEWIAEVPRVLGTYMLEREVSNAYNSVVLDGENLRNAIDLASKRVNRETRRKLEEFRFIVDGEKVKDYPIPANEGVTN